MNILKTLMEGIVLTSGKPIPPQILQQMAPPPGKNAGLFGNLISSLQLQTQPTAPLQIPTPPIPPTSDDPAAQKQYDNALAAYNQQSQAYQMNLFNLLSQRFMAMQQMTLQAQRSQPPAPTSSSTAGSGGSDINLDI